MTTKTRPTLIVNEIRAIARYARNRIHGSHAHVAREIAEQLELLADKLAEDVDHVAAALELAGKAIGIVTRREFDLPGFYCETCTGAHATDYHHLAELVELIQHEAGRRAIVKSTEGERAEPFRPSGTYVVQRDSLGKVSCVFADRNGRTSQVAHRKHHSPGGFETGYAGSGPADLALSIATHYFGENPNTSPDYPARDAWRWHEIVKSAFIASRKLDPGEQYRISTGQLMDLIEGPPA